MKIPARPVLVLIAVCCLPPASLAAATHSRPAPVGIPAPSVDAAAHAFESAQLQKDLATIDRMLSPTYLFVHGSGKLGDRRDFLAAFSNPADVFTAFDIASRRIIPVGRDGAIVAAEATVHGLHNGTKFTQHFRYADTYVKAGGVWCVVYTQVTTLTP